MYDVCLVEDEEDLRSVLSLYLEKSDYRVHTCKNMEEAMMHLTMGIPVWVIDIMLPDGNGLEILKKLKELNRQTAVVIISAKSDRFDRVVGFEVGCDDYISKPFLPAELVYRIGRLRKQQFAADRDPADTLAVADYTIDLKRRTISDKSQTPLHITSREFDTVLYLIRHQGQVVSREQLLDGVWGVAYYGNYRIVDNYIKILRKKLPDLPLETIYGYGYRYNG